MGPLRLRGHVLPDGVLRDVYVTMEGTITFEPVEGAETVVDDGWLLPGLVDSHAHLAMNSPAPPDASPAEQVEASARVHLDAGVLLLREPGSPNHLSSGVGPAAGLPRTHSAGRFLAPPARYLPGLAREVDPADLAAAATEEAGAGTGWVKVIGDFPTDAGELTANWEPSTLAAAASAAHAAGARITIHAVLPEVIAAAVDAGFDCIEHGTGMPVDLLPVMAERGIAWTPTMLISNLIRGWAAGWTPAAQQLVTGFLERVPSTVAAAARAGVILLAGTDAGAAPHGLVAREVALLLDAGVPAEQAIGAASWEARRYLGHRGVEEGAQADLLVLATDPRLGVAALSDRRAIVLDGQRVL